MRAKFSLMIFDKPSSLASKAGTSSVFKSMWMRSMCEGKDLLNDYCLNLLLTVNRVISKKLIS